MFSSVQNSKVYYTIQLKMFICIHLMYIYHFFYFSISRKKQKIINCNNKCRFLFATTNSLAYKLNQFDYFIN